MDGAVTMKKILCFVLCISFVFLFSCAYKADYPDTFTSEYCYNNYVMANPNLRLTCDAKIAKNRVKDKVYVPQGGTYEDLSDGRDPAIYDANNYIFRAIKNIPMDKYLLQARPIIFDTSKDVLIKNKDYHKDPIFDYNAILAEIVWEGSENYISVAKIDVKAIKKVICEAIKSENYLELEKKIIIKKEYTPERKFFNSEPKTDNLYLNLEITFEEYESLIWVGRIFKNENKYYLRCYIETGETVEEKYKEGDLYKAVYVELPEDISSIIAKIDTD